MEEQETDTNVFDATLLRLDRLFNRFDNLCISLSGGKGSTVLLHLAAAVAKINRKKINVLFIDREAQHLPTIDHIHELKLLYSDVINHFYWVALPLSAMNGSASYEPGWISWEDDVEWWRVPPADAITDRNAFPFYRYAMPYDEFIAEFLQWLSAGSSLVSLLGTTANDKGSQAPSFELSADKDARDRGEDAQSTGNSYPSFSPLFDWQAQDIWLFNSLTKAIYNPLYDLMYRTGMPVSQLKIQEPFELHTHQDLHRRAHITIDSSAIHITGNKSHAIAEKKILKPVDHTWHSYASFLLNTMPRRTAEQYRENIARYLLWYQSLGYSRSLPDEQQCVFEHNGIASWERICTMILDNDYRCRALSIGPSLHNDSSVRKKTRRGRGKSNEGVFL